MALCAAHGVQPPQCKRVHRHVCCQSPNSFRLEQGSSRPLRSLGSSAGFPATTSVPLGACWMPTAKRTPSGIPSSSVSLATGRQPRPSKLNSQSGTKNRRVTTGLPPVARPLRRQTNVLAASRTHNQPPHSVPCPLVSARPTYLCSWPTI